jgi:predicted HicB family RNase H-like nuclease
MKKMNNNCVRITVRIPPNLHKQMAEIANEQGRTLNMQMIRLLQLGVTHWAPDAAKLEVVISVS